jgi:hypothetical protein
MSPVFDNDQSLTDEIKNDQTRLIDYWQVHSMSKIMEPDKPKVFAETFIEKLNFENMRPAEFSVRGIRNMVTRLFSIAAARVSQGQAPWEKDEKFVEDVKNVFAEILKVARLK